MKITGNMNIKIEHLEIGIKSIFEDNRKESIKPGKYISWDSFLIDIGGTMDINNNFINNLEVKYKFLRFKHENDSLIIYNQDNDLLAVFNMALYKFDLRKEVIELFEDNFFLDLHRLNSQAIKLFTFMNF